MRFFLHEIAARALAIYLCVDCIRTLRHGLIERRIMRFSTHTDIVNWLLDWSGWSRQVFHRDTAPVRYWIEMGSQAAALLACLFVAIFGWWQPTT